MQGERSALDTTPRFVISFDVIKHFVGIQIRVVVWKYNRQRMKVQQTRAKRANYKVSSFESLMRWRGHVMFADDWAEVVNIEDVWVIATVPANNIEWVIGVHI